MIFKSTRLAILVTLVLLIVTASPVIYLITSPRYYFLGYIFPLLIVEMIILFRLIDHPNRSINYFFDAMESRDTSIRFPENIKNRDLKKIHGKLNRLTKYIQEIKTRNIAKEEFYLQLIQHSATGLIAFNPEGRIVLMNRKACEYADLPPHHSGEMLKMKNPDLYNAMTEMKAGETRLEKMKFSDSVRDVSIRSAAIRLEDGMYMLLSLQDIRQELDENELDSWIKLIRILTHEIMNSVAPITSLSDTIRRYFIKDRQVIQPEKISGDVIRHTVEGLDVIRDRGNGLIAFVDNFRKLTRVPAPVLQQVNTEEWLHHLKTLLANPVSDQRITFEIITDNRLQELEMDEPQMTQVVINIVNNAVEALKDKPSDKKISMTVGIGENGRPAIRISNNGSPIPEEIADKIFIPFFTTRENGSGIGLSLSRQIIRLHGGRLQLEAGKPETTFVITL